MTPHQQAILALPGCRSNPAQSTETVTAWTHAARAIRLFHDATAGTWDAVQRGDVLDIESDRLPTAHEAIADLRSQMLTEQGKIMERMHRAYPFPDAEISAAEAAAQARAIIPDAELETMHGTELQFRSARTKIALRLRGQSWSASAYGHGDTARDAVIAMLRSVGMLR